MMTVIMRVQSNMSGHVRRGALPVFTWFLVLAGVWCVLHVQQVSGNVVFPPGLRPNKTLLDEIQKVQWIRRLEASLRQFQEPDTDPLDEATDYDVESEMDDDEDNDNDGPGSGVEEGRSGGHQGAEGGHGSVMETSITSKKPTTFLPYFVFSKSPGKNILEFQLRRSNGGTLSTTAAKVHLYVYVWAKRVSRRKAAKRNRRKSRTRRLIKIRVFQVSADGRKRKGRRIAELRKRISSSNWHRLSLPVSLIHSLTDADNQTVKLRVRCKRCNRKVQLIMPGDAQKCRKLKKRRMADVSAKSGSTMTKQQRRRMMRMAKLANKCSWIGRRQAPNETPKVPFMVIENRYIKEETKRRYKRGIEEGSVTEDIRPSDTRNREVEEIHTREDTRPLSSLIQDSITKEERRLRFRRSSSSSVSSPTSSSTGATRVCEVHDNNSSLQGNSGCCVVSIPVDPADFGMADSIVAPSTLIATSCDGTCSARPRQHDRRRRRNRAESRRRRRKGRQLPCRPTESHPLDIWFFDHNHNLAHASLPGLVVSKCGCSRQ